MDNKATTKRMIGAVVLVLVAALLLAWLLKGKNREGQAEMALNQTSETKPILGFPDMADPGQKPAVVGEENQDTAQQNAEQTQGVVDQATNAVKDAANNIKDAAGNAVSSVNVDTVSDTTGFGVRPASTNETRKAIDKDGSLVSATGSLGSSETIKAGTSQSSKDVPQDTTQTKDSKSSTPRAVLVNERHIPTPASVESKAKTDQRTAADKAAEAKSIELAKRNAASSSNKGGSYAIQVLASSDKGKANAAAAPLRADGYKASVVTAKVGGKTVYRVVVSGYTNKVAATSAQAKMKARYTQNTGVQNSFITSGN